MNEIELKFQVAPAALPALAHWLQARGAGCVAMRARYYDHPDRLLGRAGFALRLRCEGGPWVQTLKGRGDGVMQRLEHNAPVADPGGAQVPALDLARHADSPAGRALTALLAAAGCGVEALRLQFETDFERLAWTVHHDGAEIEVALDQGAIRADGRALPIAELEFELLGGEPAALLDFARGWIEPWGLWLDVRSKAERGHLLAHGMTVASATRAKAPRLRGDVTADRALRHLVEAGLDHILPNAAALAAGLAGDEHRAQARLGLASLRDALAGSSAQDPAAAVLAWTRSLAELGRQLDGEGAGATEAGTTHAWQAWAGAAMRSPAAGLLWLDLLAYALVDRPD